MKAIAVRRGEQTPRLVERPEPEPAPGEALVETLRVGIDGTDHEVVRGTHGGFPPSEDHQVLGHEAVGVVVDANGTAVSDGTVVVPTVRRPAANVGTVADEARESNEYFARGEPDMAPEGRYVERGIVGAHGYMAEYFTSPAEFLVPVPRELAANAFLVEPISNVEKAIEHAFAARSAFDWAPESALVLGNGPLGLLALAMLQADDRFARTYCLGRRDRPDPTINIIEWLGGTYVDSRETPLPDVPAVHEPMDLVVEATGYARHAFETVDALAAGGVGVLLGIPEDWTFEIEGGRLHREFVLENKALVGSVNSHVAHFEAAVQTLADTPGWFLADLITGIYPPEDVEAAFVDDDTTIKQVIEFTTP